ncbi:putative Topless family protein [Helianthus anomalus]
MNCLISFHFILDDDMLISPFQPTPAPVPTPLAGWMSNPPAVSHPTVSGSAIGLGSPSISDALKHPRTPTDPSLDYPSADSDHMSKRTRPTGITDEGSSPMSMDFHPVQQTLLFGISYVSWDKCGDIGLWEVGSHEKLVLKNFKVWNLSALHVQCLFKYVTKYST